MIIEGKQGWPGPMHAAASDQLTRDQLLQQRLWAATGDADEVSELLAALTKEPPCAGSDQEERMRGIEGSLDSIRWACGQLKRYVGKGDKT